MPCLLEADAAASGTFVRASTNPGAGLGVFATRPLVEGAAILPFFGQLVYHDLQVAARSTRARLHLRLYGVDYVLLAGLCTTAGNWLDTGLQLRTSSTLLSALSSSYLATFLPSFVGARMVYTAGEWPGPAWVVPASCCAGRKANEPRPLFVENTRYEQVYDPVSCRGELVMAG